MDAPNNHSNSAHVLWAILHLLSFISSILGAANFQSCELLLDQADLKQTSNSGFTSLTKLKRNGYVPTLKRFQLPASFRKQEMNMILARGSWDCLFVFNLL